eukprot:scaffold16604_cov88-Skeletonema_marinoi.AAC.1
MMPREGRWKGDVWHMSHSCQRKARKVGLELGQSTSLPLACRTGLDPLIDECASCRKQTNTS